MQACDDLEDEESLKHMYHIMKGAIMLNSNRKLGTPTHCSAESMLPSHDAISQLAPVQLLAGCFLSVAASCLGCFILDSEAA